MTENTGTTTPASIKLTEDQVNLLIPVFVWMTRAETPKGGSAKGTANYWSFVGGMRPSIATLVSLVKADLLHGDALIGEDLIPAVGDFPAGHVFTQGTGQKATKWTTRRFEGMRDLGITDESHPLATPAGVSASELTKMIKDVMPDVMDEIKARREEARKLAERKAAAEQMENSLKDMIAAIEVARNNGVDVTAMEAMLALHKASNAQE